MHCKIAYAADEASPELVIGSIMPSSVGASASASAYGFTVNAAYDYEFKNGLFAGIAYPVLRAVQRNFSLDTAAYHTTK